MKKLCNHVGRSKYSDYPNSRTMKLYHQLPTICMIVFLSAGSAFAQQTHENNNSVPPTGEPSKEADSENKSSKSEGLKKIASGGSGMGSYVDGEMLEVNIESAVNLAMEVVRSTLQNLEIQIPPVIVDVPNLDAVEVNLNGLDIDIEPIIIDIPAIRFSPDDEVNESYDDDDGVTDTKDESDGDNERK